MDGKVPYTDLKAQYRNLKKELLPQIERVMEEGSFILRSDVSDLEKSLASFLKAEDVIGLNSGTDALILALRCLDLKEGDEVITVAHTFVATIAAIVHCRAKPVLVDIGDDFNMDIDLVEKAVSARTKAILPVHLNGRLCRMDKLTALAEKRTIAIIEDAAQALGASFKGKKAGTFGSVGCFSLHPMKNLGGAGDGGFAATSDSHVARDLRLLRNHGQKTKEDISCFGYNSRLDNLQAAILAIKLKHLKRWIERRREVAARYDAGLEGTPLRLPPAPDDGDFFDVYSSYVIRSRKRDDLAAYLRKNGIEVFIHWPKPLHQQPGLGLEGFALPATEKISQEVVSLPIYPEISDRQVDFVIKTIQDFHTK